MIFSSNVPKRWSFQKNRTGIWSFLYYLEKWYFFLTRKYDIFSSDEKWKIIFLKKYMEIWCFLYICINVRNMILPFCQKNQRQSSPEKMHLKVIGILNWHSRKSSSDSLTFMETFIDVSCIAFQWKKTGNLIYRIEIWLLLQFIWLEILYNEESSLICTIQSSGVVFRGMLELQLRKLFVHGDGL